MAKLLPSGKISGSLGNLTYYRLNDDNVVKTKTRKIRQSGATKKSATEFGKATRAASRIRATLYQLLHGFSDSYLQGRLTSALFEAIRGNTAVIAGSRGIEDADLQLLQGFPFNINSPLQRYFTANPIVDHADDKLYISVPEFDGAELLRKVPEANSAELCLSVDAMAMGRYDAVAPYSEMVRIAVPYNSGKIAATTWESGILPRGRFVLLTATVLYRIANKATGDILLNNKKLHPCGIVAAFISRE